MSPAPSAMLPKVISKGFSHGPPDHGFVAGSWRAGPEVEHKDSQFPVPVTGILLAGALHNGHVEQDLFARCADWLWMPRELHSRVTRDWRPSNLGMTSISQENYNNVHVHR